MSATYYNPGGLALIDNLSYLLSGSVYEMVRLKLVDGAGQGQDLESLKFRNVPDFVAGLLTFDKLKSTRLAYSFLNRLRLNARLTDRVIDSRSVIDSNPGEDVYAGELFNEQDMSENWGGFTVSHRFGKQISLGATTYIAFRRQTIRTQVTSQALTPTDVATTLNANEVSYWHVRSLWKLGLAYEQKDVSLGLSITTPSLGLFGKGSVFVNKTITGLDIDSDGMDDPFLAVSVQDDLSTTYKSSWAFGFGGSWQYSNNTIHFSSEWYLPVPQFDVMQPADLEIQSAGETVPLEVKQELRGIFNFGLGLERPFGSKVSAFGSFVTDFSAAPPEGGSTINFSNWNLYHITAGGRFITSFMELTLGLGVAFGTGTNEQLINFADVHESNALLGNREEIRVTYNRLIFILGFSFLI